MTVPAARDGPLRVFLVAGEESGDQLGAGLMQALSDRLAGRVRFEGVGGDRMAGKGLVSLFATADLAHNGLTAVLFHLPQLWARLRQAVDAVVATAPDVLIVIDSPDFNLRLARQVRRRDAAIPIIVYVSPTVWAWRPGRARSMAGFVDHLLAVLPFEPEVHRALGGPPCTYVGHSLVDRLASLRAVEGERPPLAAAAPPTVLVMPGSRRSEVRRLLGPFGETLQMVGKRVGPLDVILPAVSHLVAEIRAGVAGWPIQPKIVEGEAEKFAAFRRAHAALVASGTATLELGLAAVPMVVAYRLDPLGRRFKFLITAPSIVLTNLILGENVVPEFIDEDCTPARLADALEPLLRDSAQRTAQLTAFQRLDDLMRLDRSTPTAVAAETVLKVVADRRPQRRFDIGT